MADKIGEFMRQPLDWSWLMRNRWPWEVPETTGGVYQGAYYPFENIDWLQRQADVKMRQGEETPTVQAPKKTLKDLDPEWLAAQDPNATIMSGDTVLRQGTPTKKYVIGGQEYTPEEAMMFEPYILEQMRQSQTMTPYQQAQIENQRQQMQMQATEGLRTTDLANRQWDTYQQELNRQRILNAMTAERQGQSEVESEMAQNQQLGQQFDEFKKQLLGSLSGEGSWIERHQAETMPNKYAKRAEELRAGPQTLAGEIELSKEDLKIAKYAFDVVKSIEKTAASDPNRSLTPGEQEMVNTAKKNYQRLQERTANLSNEWIAQKEQPLSEAWRATPQPTTGGHTIYGSGREAASPAETPGVPEWMAPLINQKAGIQTTKDKYGYPIKYTGIQKGFGTLSGQALQNLAPAQREQYYGWLNWSEPMGAQRSLELTEKMMPRTPMKPSGWRPVSQRV